MMAAPLLFEATRASLNLSGRDAVQKAASTCVWDPAGAHLAVAAAQSVAIFDRAGRRLVQFPLPHAPPASAATAARQAAPQQPLSAAAAAGAAAAAAAAAAVAAAAAAAAEPPLLCWEPSGAALAALAPGGSTEAVVWLAATGELQRVGLGPEGPVGTAASGNGDSADSPRGATPTTTITALAWLPAAGAATTDISLAMCASSGVVQLYHPLRQVRAGGGSGSSNKHPGGGGVANAAANAAASPAASLLLRGALKPRRPGVALAQAAGPFLVLAGNDKRATISCSVDGGLPTVAAFGFRGRPQRMAVALAGGGDRLLLVVALTTTKGAVWLARFDGAPASQSWAVKEAPMTQAVLPTAYGAPTAVAWLCPPQPDAAASALLPPPPLAVGFESGHVLVLESPFATSDAPEAGDGHASSSKKPLAGRLVRSSSIGGSTGRRAPAGGFGGGGLLGRGGSSSTTSALDLAAAAALLPLASSPPPNDLTPVASVAGSVTALAHCRATGVVAAIGSAGAAALVPPSRWLRRRQQQLAPTGEQDEFITPLDLPPGVRATCASWSADGQLVALGTTGTAAGSAGSAGAGAAETTGAKPLATAAAVFVARLPAVCASSGSTTNVVAYLSSLREVAVVEAGGLPVAAKVAGARAADAVVSSATTTTATTTRVPLECEPSLLALGGATGGATIVAAASGHQAWFYRVGATPTTTTPAPPPPSLLLLRRGYPGRVLAMALGGSEYAAALVVINGEREREKREAVVVHGLRGGGGGREEGNDEAAPAAVSLPPLASSSGRITCLSSNSHVVVTGSSDGSLAFYLVSNINNNSDGQAPPPSVACVASWRHPAATPLAAVSAQPGGVRAVAVDCKGGVFVISAADGSAVALERQPWGDGGGREGDRARASSAAAAAAAAAVATAATTTPPTLSVLWDSSFPDVFAVAAVTTRTSTKDTPLRLWARAYRIVALPTVSGLLSNAAAAGGDASQASTALSAGRGFWPLARADNLPLVGTSTRRALMTGPAPLGRAVPMSLSAGRLAVCAWARGAGGGEGAPAAFVAASLCYGGGGVGGQEAPSPAFINPTEKEQALLQVLAAGGGRLDKRGWGAAAAAASRRGWRALAAVGLDSLDCGTAAGALAEARDARGALVASALQAEEWTLARGAFAAGLLLRLRRGGGEGEEGDQGAPPPAQPDAAETDAVERLLLAARRPCAALDLRRALRQWDRAVDLVDAFGGTQSSKKAGAAAASLPRAVRRRALQCRAARARQLERRGEHDEALALYKSALEADKAACLDQKPGPEDEEDLLTSSSSSDSSSSSGGDSGDEWESGSGSDWSNNSDDDDDQASADNNKPLPHHQACLLASLARCAARAGDARAAVAAAERAAAGGVGRRRQQGLWRRLAAELDAAGGGTRYAREAALCHGRAGDDLSAAAALMARGDLEAAGPLMARLAAREERRRRRKAGEGDGDEHRQQQRQQLRQLQSAYARALQDRGRHEEAVKALCDAGDVEAAVRPCWSRADASSGANDSSGARQWLERGCALLRDHCSGGGGDGQEEQRKRIAPEALEAARRWLLLSSSSTAGASDGAAAAAASRAALEMLLLAGQDDRAFELAAARGLLPDVCDLLLAASSSVLASSGALSRLARLARYLERCGDWPRAADVWARMGDAAVMVPATDAEVAEHQAEEGKARQQEQQLPPVPWLVSSSSSSPPSPPSVDGPARGVLLLLRRAGTADAVERAIELARVRGWSKPRPLLPVVLAELGLCPNEKSGNNDNNADAAPSLPLPAAAGSPFAASNPQPLVVERLRVLALAAAGRRDMATRRALRAARSEQAAGRYRAARDFLLTAHLALSPPLPRAEDATAATPTTPPPPPPRDLALLLSLLHTYVLVRAYASRGDHRAAALLLLRLAPSARQHFPSHAAALLTSGVIECRRAGMRGPAYALAEQLARPEHRASVPQAYRARLARLLARGEGRDEAKAAAGAAAVAEAAAPCPCCALPGPASQLDCAGCGSVVPYCVASGMRVTLEDDGDDQEERGQGAAAAAAPPPSSSSRGRCPRCRFPCRRGAMRSWLASSDGRCPMCDGEVREGELL